MRDLLRTTWLPTSVALALAWPILSSLGGAVLSRLLPLATAVVVVPLAWRWFVLSRGRPTIGRAALAGATTGFLIPAVYVLAEEFVYFRERGAGINPFGENMSVMAHGALFAGALLLGGPLGTGAGMIIALIQRRWLLPECPHTTTPASPTDGALAGAMVAILAAPVLDMVAVVLLPFEAWPSRTHGSLDMGALLSRSWLTIVPLGALIGALGVRRWRRINGQPART